MVGFVKSALNLFGLSPNSSGEEGGEINIDEFISELPKLLGFDVEIRKVEENESEGTYRFDVHGNETDSLLGDTSDMLDALAHLCMRIIRKNRGLSNAPASEGGESIRVVFDANGFRDRKAQELRDLATTQRTRVIESGGKPAYISALGPSERKIIHTQLADLGDVVSESIGRGNFKRIRVRLKEDSPHYKAPAERPQPIEGSGEREQNAGGGAPRGRRGGQGGGRGRGNRNSGGGSNGGGRNFGRGNAGGGRFRGERGPRNENRVVDGNTLGPVHNNDHLDESIDDNIGNRLRPGEEPIFHYNSNKNNGDVN